MMSEFVFVYGTLLPGESNYDRVAPHIVGEPVPGTVRGLLYDAGAYPGLVPAPQGRLIEGVWLQVTQEGIAAMDELEEYYGPGGRNDYERIRLQDARGPYEGWCYVWFDGRGLAEIPGGSWKMRECTSG